MNNGKQRLPSCSVFLISAVVLPLQRFKSYKTELMSHSLLKNQMVILNEDFV